MAESEPTRPQSKNRRRRRTPPTVEQARAFVWAVELQSYARAATELGYQNAASVAHTVARLGNALGGRKLISADSRGLVLPTVAGRAALPAAKRMIQAADAMAARGQTIRFSAYPSITSQVLRAYSELLTQTPRVALTNISEESRRDGGRSLLAGLATYDLDLVVAPEGLPAERIVGLHLYDWRLRVMVPRKPRFSALRARERLTPRDIAGLPVVAAPAGHRSRSLLDSACAKDGLQLRLTVECGSQEMLRDIVNFSGTHVAVLPDDAFGERNPDLGPLLTTDDRAPIGSAYCLYRREIADSEDSHERHIEQLADRIAAAFRGTR